MRTILRRHRRHRRQLYLPQERRELFPKARPYWFGRMFDKTRRPAARRAPPLIARSPDPSSFYLPSRPPTGWKPRPACGSSDGGPAELAGSGGNVGLARRLCALADAAAELHIPRERCGVSAGVARECVNWRPRLRGKTDIFDLRRRQWTVRSARQRADGAIREAAAAGSPQA